LGTVRNAVLQMQELRTQAERRQVMRIAVRQLERADLYLAAVCALELPEADAAIEELRDGVEGLRRQLIDARARLAG
jgi:hypothetical protein